MISFNSYSRPENTLSPYRMVMSTIFQRASAFHSNKGSKALQRTPLEDNVYIIKKLYFPAKKMKWFVTESKT